MVGWFFPLFALTKGIVANVCFSRFLQSLDIKESSRCKEVLSYFTFIFVICKVFHGQGLLKALRININERIHIYYTKVVTAHSTMDDDSETFLNTWNGLLIFASFVVLYVNVKRHM
jgi:chloramphenicol O-acetyltransferase